MKNYQESNLNVPTQAVLEAHVDGELFFKNINETLADLYTNNEGLYNFITSLSERYTDEQSKHVAVASMTGVVMILKNEGKLPQVPKEIVEEIFNQHANPKIAPDQTWGSIISATQARVVSSNPGLKTYIEKLANAAGPENHQLVFENTMSVISLLEQVIQITELEKDLKISINKNDGPEITH